MPEDNALTRRRADIAIPPKGDVTIAGQKHLVDIQPVAIAQQDTRPAQYITAKERGIPEQRATLNINVSPLSIVLAAIAALSFLIAISMASIGLTAYSNSVDRVHRQRQPSPYIFVE